LSIAYLDCFSGISGDMTLGALLHAGLKEEVLFSELKKLNLSGYRIEIQSSKRGSISGNRVDVIKTRHSRPGTFMRSFPSLMEAVFLMR